MAEVTWANLAKSVDDNTKISAEIDADILAHNEDASAHGQLGEGIYNHRIGAILDHLDEAVTNSKLLKMARAYKFIVDPGGDGDYTTIQPAIDAANADGGGRILIMNGTYDHTDDLTLYSNITLEGETPDGALVRFNVHDKGFNAVGDASPYDVGTVSVSDNSDQVVGVDTLWDANVSAGQYIQLDYRWYEIESVEDNTHLTLVDKYAGVDLAGEDYEAATFKHDIFVKDLTIVANGFRSSSRLSYVIRASFNNIHGTGSNSVRLELWLSKDISILNSDGFYSSFYKTNIFFLDNNTVSTGQGNIFQYCRDGFITDNVITAVTYRPIAIFYSKFIVVSNNVCRGFDDPCITVWDCHYCVVSGNYCYGGEIGIWLHGSTYNRIVDNHCEGGFEEGIKLEKAVAIGSIHNVVSGNTVYNVGEEGIVVSEDCDYNVVSDNNIKTVGVGGDDACIYIYKADYNNVIGNICLDSTRDGIRVYQSDYNIITGNQCKDNEEWGIYITSNVSDKNIVTGNQLLGNTAGALNDAGTNTVKDNNVVA